MYALKSELSQVLELILETALVNNFCLWLFVQFQNISKVQHQGVVFLSGVLMQ